MLSVCVENLHKKCGEIEMNDERKRPSDQEGQQGSNIDKMSNDRRTGRDHTPAPESGSKGDNKKVPTREDLPNPLSGETERSGTHMDQ
jgi:hypothetical protein